MKIEVKIFKLEELQKIHDFTLKVLENPGMKIINERMLIALAKKGAKVDFEKKVVNFKPQIITETIDLLKKDLEEGRIPKYLNGVTCEKTNLSGIQAKFGGGCVQYLDWKNKIFREPTETDLIDMIKLGQALPEVATVGNPVMYLKDKNGIRIDPKMQRVKTAALVAKYTTKPGSTEVWNTKELEFLIEIGSIVRGGKDAYLKDPCFITAKSTITPLILEKNAAEVILALAKKDLPCLIIPMPISGVSTPVSLFSNIIIGNAEILGTASAIKSVYPEARVQGGSIAGSMDMSTGTANFATPEATLEDMGLAEIHERLYGFNFGIGCYLDAKYPGIQNMIEKTFKYFALAAKKRYTYAVGLVNGGKCFCAVQALIDIQILKNIHRFLDGIVISEEEELLNLIRKVGIGGSFLQEEHTLYNYRKNLIVPELFDHQLSQGVENDLRMDMLIKAQDGVEKILARDNLYELSSDKIKAIDDIIKRAEKAL